MSGYQHSPTPEKGDFGSLAQRSDPATLGLIQKHLISQPVVVYYLKFALLFFGNWFKRSMTAEFMECTRQDAFFKGGRGYFPGHFFSLVYVAHLNFFFGGKCLVQDFFLTVKHRTWIAESSCSIFFSSIYLHIWIPLHDPVLTSIPVFRHDRRHVLEWHDMLHFELAIRLEIKPVITVRNSTFNRLWVPYPRPREEGINHFNPKGVLFTDWRFIYKWEVFLIFTNWSKEKKLGIRYFKGPLFSKYVSLGKVSV